MSSVSEDTLVVRLVPMRFILLAVAIFAIGIASFYTIESQRPDRLYTGGFVLYDQGANLLVARTLLDGGVLYRDVAYQYGPISAYSLVCGALAFGLTPHGYILSTHVINLVAIVLITFAVSAASLKKINLIWIGCVLVPILGFPGVLLGSFTDSIYISLERVCIAGVLFLWRPPGSRSRRRIIAIAVVMAAWQSVRFGGAEVALAALILLDLFASRDSLLSSIRALMSDWLIWIVGAVAASTMTFAILLAVMPAAAAFDAVAPVYVLRAYDELYAMGCSPYPVWTSMSVFVVHQLVFTCGALLSALVLWRLLRGFRARAGLAPMCAIGAFGALYFAVGCMTIIRHEFHFYQYGWLLSLAWLPLLEMYGRRAAIALIIVTAPSVAFVANQIVVIPIPETLHVVRIGTEVVLYCGAKEEVAIKSLAATAYLVNADVGDSEGRARILILVQAPGAPALLGIRPYGRNYLHLPGFVRPYDKRQLVGDVSTLRAVVVIQDGTGVRSNELRQFESTLSADVIVAIESRVVDVTDSADGLVTTYWIGP